MRHEFRINDDHEGWQAAGRWVGQHYTGEYRFEPTGGKWWRWNGASDPPHWTQLQRKDHSLLIDITCQRFELAEIAQRAGQDDVAYKLAYGEHFHGRNRPAFFFGLQAALTRQFTEPPENNHHA